MNAEEYRETSDDATITNSGPYVGDLLWFMSFRMDNQNVVRVSVDDLMHAFNIDSYEADELLEQIEYGFAERIGANQYQLTELGIKEIAKMKQSLSKIPD